MTAMRRFLARHPLGWRLALTTSVLLVSLVVLLATQDWPAPTADGALRRLGREHATSSGPVVAWGEALTDADPSRYFTAYYGPGDEARWVLGYDGARYQIGLLERCTFGLLWRPFSAERTYYPGPATPFQTVTLTPEAPLQCRLVYTYTPLSEYDPIALARLPSQWDGQVERFCLVFGAPSLARIEGWQTTTDSWETPPDWSAPIGPLQAEPLLGGVWKLTYTEPDQWEEGQCGHLRLVGYDAAGNQVSQVDYAPW